MVFILSVPENVNFGGSLKIQQNAELINRTNTALYIAANQILEQQKAILENPPHENANYFHPKVLQLANQVINDSSSLDRLRATVINAGIARGIFIHSDHNSDYILPENIDAILMSLISTLISDIKLLELVVR